MSLNSSLLTTHDTFDCFLSGAPAGEVDGTREYLSGDIHHEERRLGLWHSALGDFLTRSGFSVSSKSKHPLNSCAMINANSLFVSRLVPGITPYPGIKVDDKFYSMIESGFKMECPYYANESV